jgi:hypothetical protein
MITHNDDFIRKRSTDGTNDIPYRRCNIFLFIIQVENDILGGRANIIFNTLVTETSTLPMLAEVGCFWPMAIKGF